MPHFFNQFGRSGERQRASFPSTDWLLRVAAILLCACKPHDVEQNRALEARNCTAIGRLVAVGA